MLVVEPLARLLSAMVVAVATTDLPAVIVLPIVAAVLARDDP